MAEPFTLKRRPACLHCGAPNTWREDLRARDSAAPVLHPLALAARKVIDTWDAHVSTNTSAHDDYATSIDHDQAMDEMRELLADTPPASPSTESAQAQGDPCTAVFAKLGERCTLPRMHTYHVSEHATWWDPTDGELPDAPRLSAPERAAAEALAKWAAIVSRDMRDILHGQWIDPDECPHLQVWNGNLGDFVEARGAWEGLQDRASREPAAPAQPCPAYHGTMRCNLKAGHERSHSDGVHVWDGGDYDPRFDAAPAQGGTIRERVTARAAFLGTSGNASVEMLRVEALIDVLDAERAGGGR